MSNPWFRLYSEAVDDAKLRLLAFEDRWHFVALLCCKNMGILDDPCLITRRKIAVKMGLDLRELGEVARRLHEVGLIDQDTLQPTKWDERQFRSDSSTERVRAYRDKMKVSDNKAEVRMKRQCNVTVTTQDTDTDKETDKNILPDWLPKSVFDDFKQHRKKLKKPLSERAESLFIRELTKIKDKGHDPVECVERAILNGWLTVYEPKGQSTFKQKDEFTDE